MTTRPLDDARDPRVLQPPEPADEAPEIDAPAADEALPYRPLGAAGRDGEPAAPVAAPRRRVRPIPDARLAQGLAFVAAWGVPRQSEAVAHIEAAVRPGIEDGRLGEALAELGIGIPEGVGSDAPAWLRASVVLAVAGFTAYQTRRAWVEQIDGDDAAPAGGVRAEERTTERETEAAPHGNRPADFGSPDLS